MGSQISVEDIDMDNLTSVDRTIGIYRQEFAELWNVGHRPSCQFYRIRCN